MYSDNYKEKKEKARKGKKRQEKARKGKKRQEKKL